MEHNPIKTKITRRLFNGIMAIGAFFGLHKKVEAEVDPFDAYDDELDKELKETDYMEVLIIPEEYRFPYTAKGREVIANHLKAGKSRYEIKQFILSRCKVIKVPIQ